MDKPLHSYISFIASIQFQCKESLLYAKPKQKLSIEFETIYINISRVRKTFFPFFFFLSKESGSIVPRKTLRQYTIHKCD